MGGRGNKRTIHCYTHLGIGSGNRRDWEFYTYMADTAHEYGKLVHAFGLGSQGFLGSTPVDIADTTSHLVGGKFGTVITPIGNINFPKSGSRKSNVTRYCDLTQENQEWLRKLWNDKYGISVEQLQNCSYTRNLINIWHMNEHWDIPYVERKDAVISLFDIGG